jgi:hypothetical protein
MSASSGRTATSNGAPACAPAFFPSLVIPAQAGIQGDPLRRLFRDSWIPAYAGMTTGGPERQAPQTLLNKR